MFRNCLTTAHAPRRLRNIHFRRSSQLAEASECYEDGIARALSDLRSANTPEEGRKHSSQIEVGRILLNVIQWNSSHGRCRAHWIQLCAAIVIQRTCIGC
jgi:hypothetical protein